MITPFVPAPERVRGARALQNWVNPKPHTCARENHLRRYRLAYKCLEGQMPGPVICPAWTNASKDECLEGTNAEGITLFTLERNVVVLLWHPQEAPGIRSPHQLLTESKDVRPNFTGEVLFKVLFIASHIANTLM